MRKVIWLFCSLLCVIFLSACDPNSGKRPYDYGPAIWSDEKNNIWFSVADGTSEIGEVESGDKIIPIMFNFASGSEVVITLVDDEQFIVLLRGKGIFSPTEMRITNITQDELFNGEVEELTFTRQELPDSSTA